MSSARVGYERGEAALVSLAAQRAQAEARRIENE